MTYRRSNLNSAWLMLSVPTMDDSPSRDDETARIYCTEERMRMVCPTSGAASVGGTSRWRCIEATLRGLDMDRYDDDPDYPTAPPRVVRYGTPLSKLARRAFEETRGLAGC